ncbi:hypothetical protein RJ639_036093 [Escallonia herrerae]|uniref:BTB/POZ domain-containing protein n=1 Tax=Escallonia herrerae TaxID=1293975 RepID=A0AA88X315_9ASTE|nr:hypothetical protein RJ639_036093 [Escallonia herrerae]
MEDQNSGSAPDRIKLNVGGKLFETTLSTLRTGGPDSLLAALSNREAHDTVPVFIDRDPEIFSALLYLLRSSHLPSAALRRFTKQELADEASYYGIESQLKSALLPVPLTGIDASIVSTIKPAADGVVSTFTTCDADGSVWIAHGGQISAYDWNLTHSGTVRTHLDYITGICRVRPDIAAVASDVVSGLHFYNFSNSRHVGSAEWTDPDDPRIYKARVAAIADSAESIYASYDCYHRENSVIVIDKSTLKISSEIGRQPGSSSKSVVPTKLKYIENLGVVFGCAVTSGAFGYSGYIRLWDPRSKTVVWETNEPGSGRSSRFGDPFADVDVDVEGSSIFKVCSKSGDLGMADLRNLSEDPWVYLKDNNPSMRNMGGGGDGVAHCYRKQVFVGREGGLEVWRRADESEQSEGSYRRNYVDKEEDSMRGVIKRIEGGGDRLFVTRENVEGIEVVMFHDVVEFLIHGDSLSIIVLIMWYKRTLQKRKMVLKGKQDWVQDTGEGATLMEEFPAIKGYISCGKGEDDEFLRYDLTARDSLVLNMDEGFETLSSPDAAQWLQQGKLKDMLYHYSDQASPSTTQLGVTVDNSGNEGGT